MEKVLCLLCQGPSAVFHKDEETGKVVRLAKTMRRITAKKSGLNKQYVHEYPCLGALVQNWAKYVVDNQKEKTGLKALENENQQADLGDAGKDGPRLDSEVPLP